MKNILCRVDDKHVPIYRVLWVADVPHFCGDEQCQAEGQYEVRLEYDESLWANRDERDAVVAALEAWRGGMGGPDDPRW